MPFAHEIRLGLEGTDLAITPDDLLLLTNDTAPDYRDSVLDKLASHSHRI